MYKLAQLVSLAAAMACGPPTTGPQFPARPPDCVIEVFKALPGRPYIEIETLPLPSVESMSDVIDRVHAQACRDGGDAVYAPKNGRVYSYAIVLKWNDAPAPAAAPTPAPAPVPPPPAAPTPPPNG